MAKKRKAAKEEPERESPFGKYKDVIVSATEHFVQSEIGNIENWFRSVVHIRKKIRKLVVFVSLSAAGTTILLYGVTRLLMDYFPTIRDGVLYTIVGAIAIIAGMVYRRI